MAERCGVTTACRKWSKRQEFSAKWSKRQEFSAVLDLLQILSLHNRKPLYVS